MKPKESTKNKDMPEINKEKIKQVLHIDEKQSERIYDSLRKKVTKSVEQSCGKTSQKGIEYVLLIPDFFILLWRLLWDKDVAKDKKAFIAGVIIYLLLPIDFIPDFIPGIGFLDDLVLIALALDMIFVQTEKDVLKRNWSGEGEILDKIQSIIEVGHNVLSEKVFSKITLWIQSHIKHPETAEDTQKEQEQKE
jgi:uncharacterized membrane protein YkvA (DUF1232 family)